FQFFPFSPLLLARGHAELGFPFHSIRPGSNLTSRRYLSVRPLDHSRIRRAAIIHDLVSHTAVGSQLGHNNDQNSAKLYNLLRCKPLKTERGQSENLQTLQTPYLD